MKVIVAGGRKLTDYGLVVEAIHVAGFEITEVVSGACGLDADDPKRDAKPAKGGDSLGEDWAFFHGIDVRRFYASWKRLGLKAGPLRNAEMAEYAEALIALPGGSGTANMVKLARAKGLPIWEGGKLTLPTLPKQQEMLQSEEPITLRGGYGNGKSAMFPRRERDEEGNILFPACSLREAERLKHGLEGNGFDARIHRDPLRVVAKEKGLG